MLIGRQSPTEATVAVGGGGRVLWSWWEMGTSCQRFHLQIKIYSEIWKKIPLSKFEEDSVLWVMVVEVGGEVEDLSTPSYLDQRITENSQLCHRTIGMARRWPSCQGPNKITGRLKKIGARCHIEAGGGTQYDTSLVSNWFAAQRSISNRFRLLFVTTSK